jgi:hypothetical protein
VTYSNILNTVPVLIVKYVIFLRQQYVGVDNYFVDKSNVNRRESEIKPKNFGIESDLRDVARAGVYTINLLTTATSWISVTLMF